MTRYGLDTLGSLEIARDDTLGWTLRAYSAPERSGDSGQSHATLLDEELALAVLDSAPKVLLADGYQRLGPWRIDEAAQAVWANVAPLKADGAVPLSAEEVDEILETEVRWKQEGHGRASARG